MSSPTLRRTLGRWDLTAIGVNQVAVVLGAKLQDVAVQVVDVLQEVGGGDGQVGCVHGGVPVGWMWCPTVRQRLRMAHPYAVGAQAHMLVTQP